MTEQMSSDPFSVLMATGPMPVEQVVRIGREIASALKDVHGQLWPSAILVSEDGVEILPPGGVERVRYGQYSAPECTLGHALTPASDVFSIGAILHHALAGRPAFRGDTPAAVMLAACTDSPLELPPQVPRQIEEVLRRCLERDPSKRYPTPTALRDALAANLQQALWPGRRMLATDDDAPLRELYAQTASRVGVEADIVASGRDVVEAFKSHRYDIALLDMNLPRLSGWEVLDFLRARSDCRPRSLYIITGYSDLNITAADQQLVTAVLYKPVVPEELRLLISETLRGPVRDLRAILRQTGHRIISAA